MDWNTGAEFYSRGVESYRRHVDVSLAPDEMRIADPDVAIAKLFRHFRQMNHLLSGPVGKSPTPNSKALTQRPPLTTGLARKKLGWRRLLAAAGNADFAVDNHVGNAR